MLITKSILARSLANVVDRVSKEIKNIFTIA
jgi:hypothetical protein